MKKEKQNISKVLGKYLPPEVVERVADERQETGHTSQIVHGTCLITDAGQYTTLSEQLSPQELNAFMKSYYETLFKPIKEPIVVFQLLCLLETADMQQKELCEIFRAGLQAFRQRSFPEAAHFFSQALQASPGDGPSQFYFTLCKKYELSGYDDGWDGLICIESK